METALHTGQSCRFDHGSRYLVDPYDQDSIDLSIDAAEPLPIHLEPLRRVLLYTEEVVRIPLMYAGLVQLRSTFARMGLLAPPTFADPGFQGTLTMELFNASTNHILIHPGMEMWELLLIPAPFANPYKGRYQNQPHHVVIPVALEPGT